MGEGGEWGKAGDERMGAWRDDEMQDLEGEKNGNARVDARMEEKQGTGRSPVLSLSRALVIPYFWLLTPE
jgi:hypothetical protein